MYKTLLPNLQNLSENPPDPGEETLIKNWNLKIDAGSRGQNNTEERRGNIQDHCSNILKHM